MKNLAKKDPFIMVGDFETVVLPGEELFYQKETSVWSAACDFIYKDDPRVFGNIEKFIEYLINMRRKVLMYFHNLKFDGSFIIDYLLRKGYVWRNKRNHEMISKSFKALISDKNRFYSITIKTPYAVIEFWDSSKIIPFSLEDAGKAFETKHRKLTMEYEGYRYPNCPISEKEYAYIINDILCLKECLLYMLSNGHNRMTIGSCCLKEFKELYEPGELKAYFPDLNKDECPVEPLQTIDRYIRKTYKGAWCYLLRPGKQAKGFTFDVNSLYPFVMHSMSGNYYPVGAPHWFEGQIPPEAYQNNRIWFVHLKCRFQLKDKHLPTIQIKNSFLYKGNEWLKTSDIYYKGEYYSKIIKDGVEYTNKPDLYLTCKDYELLMNHYTVEDLEIVNGCWFNSEIGLFDEYIDKWNYKKEHAKNKVERTEAKLFNNNLYGKFAMSDNSSYMEPVLADDIVEYVLHESHDRDTLFIPVGSMITANARYYTITHAQMNYEIFCYADTDSLHLLDMDEIPVKGIETHQNKLGKWKMETNWSSAIFLRQKTYAEFIRKQDGEKCNPHWEMTCAGLSKKGKKMFFAMHPITDFKVGVTLPKANLKPKRVKGGVILVPDDFSFKVPK